MGGTAPEHRAQQALVDALPLPLVDALPTASMVCHMKTTLNIDDTVMRRLKEAAEQRRTTMSALVENIGPRQSFEINSLARRSASNPLADRQLRSPWGRSNSKIQVEVDNLAG